MKKILALVLMLTLTCSLFTFTACGDNSNENVLKVGMECGYQPYNWTQLDDSNGAVPIYGKPGQYANGYDVQVAKKIAERMGKTLQIHAYEWGALVNAVDSGVLDLIIAGMSPTDERRAVIDFSNPYYTSNLVIVVRKDGAYKDATSLTDFSGAKICAQGGTFHDEVIDQINGVVHAKPLVDFPALINALKMKTIDGYIAEQPGATADCNGNSEFKFIPLINNQTGFAITDLSNVTLAVGLKKGSSYLSTVNEVIAEMSTNTQIALMEQAILWAQELDL